MGRDFRSLHNPENKVADSFLAILEPTKEKMAFLAINFALPQWFARHIPWRLNKVINDETGFLRDLCRDIVHEKRASITATKATAKELEADILGTMMLGGDFTDDELIDQMLTFLAAGVCLSTILSTMPRETNTVYSMKQLRVPSPGPAIFSRCILISRNAFVPKYVKVSHPAIILSPGATSRLFHFSTGCVRKSSVCIQPSPSLYAKLFGTA